MDMTPESPHSADDLDLSPRQPVGPAPRVRTRRRWLPIAVLAGVLVVGGIVLSRFLTSAIDYYCNVDEIGVRDGCDPDRRLRIQGEVDEGSVSSDGAATTFTITFNGSQPLPVRYDGDPGGIFQECMPVVVHGRIVDGTFEGDRIEVKHSNEYSEANPERVDDAESPACSQSA